METVLYSKAVIYYIYIYIYFLKAAHATKHENDAASGKCACVCVCVYLQLLPFTPTTGMRVKDGVSPSAHDILPFCPSPASSFPRSPAFHIFFIIPSFIIPLAPLSNVFLSPLSLSLLCYPPSCHHQRSHQLFLPPSQTSLCSKREKREGRVEEWEERRNQ